MNENYDFMNILDSIKYIKWELNEKLILSNFIKIYNSIFRLSERILIISNIKIYILKKNKIKKFFYINDLLCICSSIYSNEIIFKFNKEKDLHVNIINNKNKIFKCILMILETFYNINIFNFYFLNELNLNCYLKNKGQFNLPNELYLKKLNVSYLLEYFKEENEILITKRKSTITFFNQEEKNKIVTILDFELIKILGKGAFGKVILGKNKNNNNLYAIKQLNKIDIINKNQLEHTKAEKLIMQHINHPFLVSLEYAFQTEDNLYFVMEFMHGGELFYHICKEKKFSEEKTKFYICCIILGLGYLHSKDYIYRDLKLENILLDKNGYPKIADFGLAKFIELNDKAKTFCGTPDYLAPEIILGEGHNRPADWWSLGVLTYEMLFGIPPFFDNNLNNKFKKIVTENVKFSDEIQISENCKDFISKLLIKNPKNRLGSISDCLELMSHPWVKDLNWSKWMSRKLVPEFIPNIDYNDILGNFDKEYVKNEKLENNRLIIDVNKLEGLQSEFKEFNYIK